MFRDLELVCDVELYTFTLCWKLTAINSGVEFAVGEARSFSPATSEKQNTNRRSTRR